MKRNGVQIKTYVAKIDDLIPTNENPRKIDPADFAKLKKSLEEFPEMKQLREIVVDEDNKILGGHQRIFALKDLGYADVTVKQVTGLTEHQKREFIIKDNTAAGDWDQDILASDWDLDDLKDFGLDDDLLEKVEAKQSDEIIEDELPEVNESAPAESKLGEIYQLGEHRVICGDSTIMTTYEQLLDGRSADMVITDPPYNVALGMDETPEEAKKRNRRTDGLIVTNDKMSDSEFHDFLESAYRCMNQSLKQGGAFYIWHADSEGYNFRSAAHAAGLNVKQCLIWIKNSLVMGRQDYQWIHEPCLYGWRDGGAHYFIADRTKATAYDKYVDIDPDTLSEAEAKKILKDIIKKRSKVTVIRFNKPSRSLEHPTMKPVGLFAEQITNSSRKGDTVLDPFLGSGTTLIAAEQTGRVCYGIELDPKYVDVIRKRYWKHINGDNETGWQDGTPAI